MQAFRPIHPQILFSKFAQRKAWINRLCETIGADPGVPKIKNDATTIVLEAIDSKSISPQVIEETASAATTTGQEVSDGAMTPAKTIPAKTIAAKTIGPKASAAIPTDL